MIIILFFNYRTPILPRPPAWPCRPEWTSPRKSPSKTKTPTFRIFFQDSDGSNWLQSKRMVEASLIESYEDNEEEMIDVRPIVSLDEGSSSVPTNFNSDQMVVMNSLDINSMTSNSPGLQSGTFCAFCSSQPSPNSLSL